MQESFIEAGRFTPPPLERVGFAHDFNEPGSKIKNADLFMQHARTICAAERNYLALFALDVIMQNREGKYRKDKVTPDINHQLDIFFQIQNFKKYDELDLDSPFKYLPNYLRPDIMEFLAFIHDEGEDKNGFSKEALKDLLHKFLGNIDDYVTIHRQLYPNIPLGYPTPDEKNSLFTDIPLATNVFDYMTKNYKGVEERNNQSYFEYARGMIGYNASGILIPMDAKERQARAISCALKVVDKSVNGATISVRNQKMIEAMVDGDELKWLREEKKFLKWAHKQIAETHVVFFDKKFSNEVINSNINTSSTSGFINEMMRTYPETGNIGRVLKSVIALELNIYRDDVSNNGSDLENLDISCPEYDNLALSPRLNLLNITKDRLLETHRIDKAGQNHPRDEGMYRIKFSEYQEQKKPQPVPLMHLDDVNHFFAQKLSL